MSNYNKATNFSIKDILTSGDPDKVVSGVEIDNEFDAISSAVSSKADKVTAATTDNLAALDSNGNLKDSGGSIISVAPPVGSITMYGGASAPSGWLYCNGQNVSRTTYPELFSAIGETFGAGDGTNTFNVPDLRGEFVRGWDDGRGVDSGRSFGSSQEDAFQGHFHNNPAGFTLFNTNQGGISSGDLIGTNSPQRTVEEPTNDNVNGSPRTADETRPRNIALMYIIKT